MQVQFLPYSSTIFCSPAVSRVGGEGGGGPVLMRYPWDTPEDTLILARMLPNNIFVSQWGQVVIRSALFCLDNITQKTGQDSTSILPPTDNFANIVSEQFDTKTQRQTRVENIPYFRPKWLVVISITFCQIKPLKTIPLAPGFIPLIRVTKDNKVQRDCAYI